MNQGTDGLAGDYQGRGHEQQGRYAAEVSRLKALEAQLTQDKADFEREKQRMMSPMVKDSDLINLNVCGEKMTIRRATLCQVPDSFLAAMFSGRWDDNLARDDKGRVYLEWNPVCFRALINALIHDSHNPGEQSWMHPRVPPEHLRDLEDMMAFLGIDPAPVKPKESMVSPEQLDRTLKSIDSRIWRIENDGCTVRALHGSPHFSYPHAFAMSSLVLPRRCRWEVGVTAMPGDDSVFLGILRLDLAGGLPEIRIGRNAIGWYPKQLPGPFKQGDQVRMELDVDAGNVTISTNGLRCSQSLTLPGLAATPNQQRWHALIGLTREGAAAELLSIAELLSMTES